MGGIRFIFLTFIFFSSFFYAADYSVLGRPQISEAGYRKIRVKQQKLKELIEAIKHNLRLVQKNLALLQERESQAEALIEEYQRIRDEVKRYILVARQRFEEFKKKRKKLYQLRIKLLQERKVASVFQLSQQLKKEAEKLFRWRQEAEAKLKQAKRFLSEVDNRLLDLKKKRERYREKKEHFLLLRRQQREELIGLEKQLKVLKNKEVRGRERIKE